MTLLCDKPDNRKCYTTAEHQVDFRASSFQDNLTAATWSTFAPFIRTANLAELLLKALLWYFHKDGDSAAVRTSISDVLHDKLNFNQAQLSSLSRLLSASNQPYGFEDPPDVITIRKVLRVLEALVGFIDWHCNQQTPGVRVGNGLTVSPVSIGSSTSSRDTSSEKIALALEL